jgi:hypothetical protein
MASDHWEDEQGTTSVVIGTLLLNAVHHHSVARHAN